MSKFNHYKLQAQNTLLSLVESQKHSAVTRVMAFLPRAVIRWQCFPWLSHEAQTVVTVQSTPLLIYHRWIVEIWIFHQRLKHDGSGKRSANCHFTTVRGTNYKHFLEYKFSLATTLWWIQAKCAAMVIVTFFWLFFVLSRKDRTARDWRSPNATVINRCYLPKKLNYH